MIYKNDYAEAHYNLAYCQRKLGNFDQALEGYRKALTIKPDYASAESNMLDLLKHMNDFDINKKLLEASSRLGISSKLFNHFHY